MLLNYFSLEFSSKVIKLPFDVLFQLSSLSRHAEDLFGEMISESSAILNRTVSLQGRVDKLAVKVKNLDSNVEEGSNFYLAEMKSRTILITLSCRQLFS